MNHSSPNFRMRARNRVLKFIRRRGIVYTAGGHWTVAHWAWLGKICLPIKIDQATLAEYLLGDRVSRGGQPLPDR